MRNKPRTPKDRLIVWLDNPYISVGETAQFEQTSELIKRLGIDQMLIAASRDGLSELKAVVDSQRQTELHTELRAILKADGFNVLDPSEYSDSVIEPVSDGITFEQLKLAIEKGRS